MGLVVLFIRIGRCPQPAGSLQVHARLVPAVGFHILGHLGRLPPDRGWYGVNLCEPCNLICAFTQARTQLRFLALLRALPCNTGSVMLKPFPSMDCDDVDARLPVGLAGTIVFCGGIPGKSPQLVCDRTPSDAEDRRSRAMVTDGLISLACFGSCGSLFPCPVPLEETRLLTLVLPYSQVRREKVHQKGASHSVAHVT